MEKTPDWTSRVMQEACQSSSWEGLVDAVELRIKKSNNLTKRFAEYTEYEQAIIVEQEIKNLEIESNSSLNDFGRCLKDVVDDKLIEHIGLFKSNENYTNVERLMNFSSASIIEILDKSPPELFTTMKIFLNRRLPDKLRPYIWSYLLQLKASTLSVLLSSRIAPSLDMLLSRRCHILIDRHFADISSRALAGLIKSVVTAFMRRNQMPLPDDKTEETTEVLTNLDAPAGSDCEVEGSGGGGSSASILRTSFSEASSCQMYDRLVFLAVPLAVVIKDGSEMMSVVSNMTSKDSGFQSFSAFEGNVKPQLLVESGLQNMAGVQHVALLSEDGRVNYTSVYLGVTQSLIKKKNPMLHEHFMTLTAVVGRGEADINNRFYDFLNESLLRGLSGLLNLETCQFVWDQCFVVGFIKMLPLIATALVLGCAKELQGITHADSVVDSWTSFCHHATVETIQRLMSTQCAPELFDLFDKTSMYMLDYNEDDDFLLQVVVEKLLPSEKKPSDSSSTLTPTRPVNSPTKNPANRTNQFLRKLSQSIGGIDNKTSTLPNVENKDENGTFDESNKNAEEEKSVEKGEEKEDVQEKKGDEPDLKSSEGNELEKPGDKSDEASLDKKKEDSEKSSIISKIDNKDDEESDVGGDAKAEGHEDEKHATNIESSKDQNTSVKESSSDALPDNSQKQEDDISEKDNKPVKKAKKSWFGGKKK